MITAQDVVELATSEIEKIKDVCNSESHWAKKDIFRALGQLQEILRQQVNS